MLQSLVIKRIPIGVLATVGAVACATATPARPEAATPATADTRSKAEPKHESEETQAQREALEGLRSAAEHVSAGPKSDHGGLVQALRELSKVLELGPNMEWTAIEQVRNASQNLDPSDSLALSQTTLVKNALGAALQTLVARPSPERNKVEYQKSVRAFRRAIEKIDTARSLLDQHPSVAAALRAVTDGLYLARGAEAPFGETGPEDDTAALSLESAIEEAQAAVLTLGQMDWTQARGAASRALAALADVVAAADERKAFANEVSEIRLQAERVQYAGSLTFGRAGWIKAGLESALDALEALRPAEDECLAKWTRGARRAVASVEERGSLAFQRAAAQDAFRATVDAFVVIAPPPACR